MAHTLLIVIIIVALSVALLSIRLLMGKDGFGSADVDDNPALRSRGIDCPRKQDEQARRKGGLLIAEHSKDKARSAQSD